MPSTLPYDEKNLLHQIAAGDADAFSRFFHYWHQQLGHYIYNITGSFSIAEEIVQDVFVTVWTKRELLLQVEQAGAYIYRLSRNKTLNHLRNIAREKARNTAWAYSYDLPSDTQEREIYFQLIDEAIAQLPPQQKKAWTLSRREGLMYEEIARQMQLSRETVKRHIQLAIRFIMSYVKQHAELHVATAALLNTIL